MGQKSLDKSRNAILKEVDKVANTLKISTEAASDVVYLRTRSRWTQELEDRLLEEHKNGNFVNVMDFK